MWEDCSRELESAFLEAGPLGALYSTTHDNMLFPEDKFPLHHAGERQS